jgi:asparagine synthase (glutamine-hydrolysing)
LSRGYAITHDAQDFLLMVRKEARGVFALHELAQGRFYAFGTLFGAQPAVKQGSAAAEAACALSSSVWGRYVAFLHDESGWSVFRDPSGAMACWRARAPNFDTVFSSMEDAKPCLLESGFSQPDWQAFHQCVRHGRIAGNRSGIEGVNAIEPGHMQTLGSDAQGEAIWRPEDFMRVSAEAGRPDIGETLRACVSAWASLHDTIAHQLSGGLDSSCVLACLTGAIARDKLEVWSFYSNDPSEEDERIYARSVAARHCVELHECEMRADGFDFEALSDAPLPALPALSWLSFADQHLVQWQSERKPSALMSGEGGDHLFLRSHSPLFAIDYARRFGLCFGLWTKAREGALISGHSIWEIAARAIRHGVSPDSVHSTPPEPDAFGLGPGFEPAAPARGAGRYPGKAQQSRALAQARDYHGASVLNTRLDGFPAMLSQPFIEACLSIPTYEFGAGGVDRAPLRRGFAHDLPKIVIERRSKAGTTRYTIDALIKSLPQLRPRLIDGETVKALGLDRDRLDRTLRAQALIADPPLDQILGLIAAEYWLARWRA